MRYLLGIVLAVALLCMPVAADAGCNGACSRVAVAVAAPTVEYVIAQPVVHQQLYAAPVIQQRQVIRQQAVVKQRAAVRQKVIVEQPVVERVVVEQRRGLFSGRARSRTVTRSVVRH